MWHTLTWTVHDEDSTHSLLSCHSNYFVSSFTTSVNLSDLTSIPVRQLSFQHSLGSLSRSAFPNSTLPPPFHAAPLWSFHSREIHPGQHKLKLSASSTLPPSAQPALISVITTTADGDTSVTKAQISSCFSTLDLKQGKMSWL